MKAGEDEIKTIRELIDWRARTQPEGVFLISPETGRAVTFGALRAESVRLSARLRQEGLEHGDKAAFLLDNGLFTAQLFLGAIYGGFVVVPLNTRAGVSQLSYTLEHCDAKVVFVGGAYGGLIREVLSGVGRPVRVVEADGDGVVSAVGTGTLAGPGREAGAEAEVLLMYTSGSTGRPKAAVHTHRSVLAGAANSVRSHQLSAADRSLLVLPLYHINAECVTLVPALLSGGSVVVPHRFSVSQFWDWLEEHRCTWSALVPTIISQLLDWKDPRAGEREAAFRRVRFLRSSSAPLTPSLHREFLDKFKLLLIQAMGSTEAGNIFSNPLPPGENKIGSPGLAWGFETRIVNREGVEMSAGEPGEVLLRGPALMRGYYKDPVGTEAVLGTEGWLRTGDLAYRDEEGYFFVVGRSKELIIKGGVNIAPRQVDEVLESHPGVLEAAAVGVPDRYVGEDLVAFVVLRAGMAVEERELLAYCESRLGSFKTPTWIRFAEDLPKGPSGKVQRLRLVEEAGRPAAGRPVGAGGGVPGAGGRGREGGGGMPVGGLSVEEIIAETWREQLKETRVGGEDNFFALGGHSLLAIQCISRLREKLPVTLSLSDFFEHATVAQQAALVRRRLSPEGRTGGGRTEGDSGGGPEAIPLRDRGQPCPLSPAQQRLWFEQQLHPGLPVYNEAEAVRLRGELDCGALERALNAVMARHELLRATIQVIDDQPTARVHESWPLQLKRIDLSGMDPAGREAEVGCLLVSEPRRLYRLEAEPGIRVTLVQLSAREHVLILMMHHIICDWSSEGVLWRDLSVLYRACLRGGPVELPPLPIQHGDYAAWQRRQDAERSFGGDLGFWEENLRGAPDLLELPADRPRPAVVTYRGARQRFRLEAGLGAALRELSRREKKSLFTVFAAGLDALLHRYTGSEDILVGIPLADRDRTELQPVIGFLLHTHVLRTRVAAEGTFRGLLARVQAGVLDLYAHRAAPFDQVVRRVRPRRDLSYAPLFQVVLNWRDRDQQLSFIGLEGLEVESLLAESRTAKFDLTLMVTDGGEEIWLEMEYSTDLFDDDRIARMAGHYETLLRGAAADPDRRVGELPLLTEPERRQLLVEWNETAAEYPREKCVHELFEEQVERTPEAVAVVFGGEQMTYRQLNDRADRLARRLAGLGVGPETLVGICVERSLEMVVGLLGILKAGGAYVPLDPEYPAERLAFMLEDAGVPVLLTQEHLEASLPVHQARVIRLDADWPAIAGESGAGVENQATAGHPAYMIYTSGSTGRPKGVTNTHRGIVNRLLWMQEAYRLTSADRVLQKTPFSFDVSVWEFFWPLLAGARLVVARPGGHRDGAYLAQLIAREKITTLHFVPSMLQVFLQQEGLDAACASLQRVVCSGEALSVELQRRFFSILGAELHNLYGPTEASVDVTCWACARDSHLATVPIGRPIANTRIYILDGRLQPVPIGIPGELHVGGVGLARGYHHRPELTAEKFIPDPFSPEAGARLYKTGDLARYLGDGAIEYLGRMDQQVKIRGFRVELGEIEAVLALHAGVRQTVVAAREDEPGNQRLAAYVVPADPAKVPGAPELRDFLRQRLPDYMVPTAFVALETLPLSPNGKVDRKALPVLGSPGRSAGQGYVEPRTPAEETLAGVWAEVLKVEAVGVHDNFFDLGGHSLLATQVVARLRGLLEVDLALRDLFEFPTIAGLAGKVPTLQGAAVARVARLLPAARDQRMPLSFAQQRLWFLDRFGGAGPEYHMAHAFRLRGELNRDNLERAFNEMVARHESLRTRFVEEENGPVQVITPEARVPMRVDDLSGLESSPREEAIGAALRRELDHSFDLSRGPLLRIKLLALGAREHVLFWCCHHIISDGWSQGVFCRELAALYAALQEGEAPSLPGLTVQYADYAVWQRDWLQGEELERQLGYWRKQLKNAPSLELPCDRPRPARQTFKGAQRVFSLSKELAAKLKTFNREENVTPFMSLLGVFQVLLARYGGQSDILVGAPVANRRQVELENLIGFFVNTLVLRVDLSGEPGFREVAARVRRTALDAYQRQDAPFEKLVEEINPERDLSRHPFFQVMFALQNTPWRSLDLAGLEVSRVRLSAHSTRFDLELHLRPEEDTWSGSFHYNTDLFDAATIDRMAVHYQTLLESALAEPETPVSALAMLTADERQRILAEGNDTAADYSNVECVHELFEEQAGKNRDAIALMFEDRGLTYGELNESANRLARQLRGLGVGPGVLVGICLERSLEMMVGLLGILKAGGACVPLDPGYPEQRLRFMLEDAQIGLLLTKRNLLDRLPERNSRLLFLDDEQAWPGESPAPFPASSAADPAYVLFTSGSTGRPKGVLVEHRTLRNLISWQMGASRAGPGDRTLQFASISFDVSFQEIFATLSSGGALVIAPESMRGDMAALSRLLRERNVFRAFLPFAVLNVLAQELSGSVRAPLVLREIITAGDQLRITPPIASLFDRLPDGVLVNQYGPTETHVASALVLEGPSSSWPPLPPIGRPIANTSIHILDAHFEPMASGLAGEICIGGDGLARGYLNRPELTAEKFIPNPFSRKPGARLYRTGDLARYRSDGNIEFLGRMDHQAKIRGFRVELGEIEAALASHAGVREAVVAAREDEVGQKSLLAYFVAVDRSAAPAAGELREFLEQKLPPYMVPVAFVEMERLPLTPTGKIDRKALPAPEFSRSRAGREYVAPRTATEHVLACVWAELLGMEKVGVRDNFFDLGGHSLLATRLASRVRLAFELELPVRVLFEAPTIEGMSASLLRLSASPRELGARAELLLKVAGLSGSEVDRMLAAAENRLEGNCLL